ncbi:MAG: HAMP domain-containing histidine kinase [Epsilonproteobacteria bacterium]|nr:sensor histidine kinase [Campylobacterota bacterium]NPA57228.1 HAMP domain-containing histidine kinase [Campylobacterota bacterium]
MNRSERESLFKNFIVFFTLLELMLTLIFFFFYTDKKKDIYELLLKRMQVCSYTLSCKDFDYDFYPKNSKAIINRLYSERDEIYALFPLPTSKKYYLKISYKRSQLQEDIEKLALNILTLFAFASLLIMFLSFILTLYTLKPIRQALQINQEFIKDILHDFNTPISAIVLNLEMLKKECQSPFIDRISQSVETILSLQENFRLFLKNIKSERSKVNINQLLKERIKCFSSTYPNLHFHFEERAKVTLFTQQDLFIRIIDNLLSNACKYNKKGGFVRVIVERHRVIIEDSGRGIKNSKRVFDRFYKESDRGIGIGLSIVKKLCDELDIKIEIESEVGKGTRVILSLPS